MKRGYAERTARSVFEVLGKNGMVRAFMEIGEEEFVYPSFSESRDKMEAQKRRTKVIVSAVIVSVVMVLAAAVLVTITGTKEKHAVPVDQPSTTNNLDQTGPYGMTPLHMAVTGDDLHGAKLLCEGGARIDHPDDYGWTPLHWAVFKKNREMCALLLQYGANSTVKTRRKWFTFSLGLTPRDMADRLKQSDISSLLRSQSSLKKRTRQNIKKEKSKKI